MDNDRLIAAIDAAEQDSYGSDDDSILATERARAILHYLGDPNLDPAEEGRSNVVDRSVFETIQSIMPSLTRIFASGDDVVTIQPRGPEDEQAAEQESDYLNYIVTQRNPWFEIVMTWFTDALLTKNAYCMAYWDTKQQTEIETYERQTDDSLKLILDDESVQVLEQVDYPDPDYKPEVQTIPDPMTGQPIQIVPPPPTLHNIKIRRVNERGSVAFKVLPPERCKVSEKTPDFSLKGCDYFEYYEITTISALRQMGIEVPDDVAMAEADDTQEDLARDQFAENQLSEHETPDPSMRRVKARMIWIRFDENDDGIAELQYVIRIGNEIVYREEISRIPVASIVPIPLPHRHIGLSLADITIPIERTKTSILRQGLDNLYLSNNGRTFVSDKINLDDLTVSRPGGIVRGAPGAIFGQDIAPIPTQFMFPQAMQGLEYMDQTKEAITGTSNYFTGLDQNALNKTATGIQQLTTMAAQRVEQYARVFAFGVEDLFSIAHELILKHGHRKEVVRIRNKWFEIDPTNWRTRTDIRIKVGYAAGNKDAQVARLMNMLNIQREAIQINVATPKNIYDTVVELTKASDFPSPERFWTDPSTIPPQPPMPDPVVQMEQIKQQSTQQIKQLEEAGNKYRADLDNATKKHIAELNSQTELVKTKWQLEHQDQHKIFDANNEQTMFAANLETDPKYRDMSIKEEENTQLGELVAKVMESQQQQNQLMMQAFGQIMEAVAKLGGPKRIVRDKSGRAVGAIPDETLQ